MVHLLTLIERRGYWVIFSVALAEVLGTPVPAALALLAGGAAAASGTLRGAGVFTVAVVAMLLGDSVSYLLGRMVGWRLLSFLCVLSISPETCVLRSAELFHKRGRKTLLSKVCSRYQCLGPTTSGQHENACGQFLLLDLLAPPSTHFLTALSDTCFTAWRPRLTVDSRPPEEYSGLRSCWL